MKKLSLLFALSALGASSASAQLATGTPMQATKTHGSVAEVGGISNGTVPVPVGTEPSGKTTVGGSRWYNYVDHLILESPGTINNEDAPYMWDKFDGMAIFSAAGGGLVADTISLVSYGTIFDPAFRSTTTGGTGLGGFNDPGGYAKGNIVVTRARAYTIDSVRVYGAYGRNNTRTTTVDTLRISLTYGNGGTSDLGFYFFPGSMASYGVDTVRYMQAYHDTLGKNTLRGYGTGGTAPSLKIVDIYLKNTDTGSKGFAAAIPSYTVPAGNLLAVGVTFKTGDTYTPFVDTIFYGSARSSNPFGRGMFRPSIFEQTAGAFPKYNAGYYNVGFSKFFPNGNDPGWRGFYLPSYAYTSADFDLEFPNIDIKVSCPTCNTIQELSITDAPILDKISAFPNPSNATLNVPFTVLEKATVNVSISNLMGQVVATQDMGSFNAGQKATASFNTSNLAAGIYLYTVEANGQRVTNRFTVAH